MSINKTVRHFKSSLHVLLMSLWKLPAPVFGGNAPNSSTDAVFRDVLPAAKFMAACVFSPISMTAEANLQPWTLHLPQRFLRPCRVSGLGPRWPLLHVWQEGKQASLAADFSVTQFKHLGRLLMVHGRNSYKRSAALSQFVIHRSLCISTMQVWRRLLWTCTKTLQSNMFFITFIAVTHTHSTAFLVSSHVPVWPPWLTASRTAAANGGPPPHVSDQQQLQLQPVWLESMWSRLTVWQLRSLQLMSQQWLLRRREDWIQIQCPEIKSSLFVFLILLWFLLIDFVFLPPPGGFLLRFLFRLGPALPRIPDYRVRRGISMTYQRSIWRPRSPGISSAPESFAEIQDGGKKSELVLSRAHVLLHWFIFCLLQLFHRLHHVPRLLTGVGQRCEVGGGHAVPRVI